MYFDYVTELFVFGYASFNIQSISQSVVYICFAAQVLDERYLNHFMFFMM